MIRGIDRNIPPGNIQLDDDVTEQSGVNRNFLALLGHIINYHRPAGKEMNPPMFIYRENIS